jgi:transcriptional regulator with XRE-family HTH domain
MLTQANLAHATGMSQNNISRLEDETYGKHTLSSLKRIAQALDVALVVRLVPFSQYIDWLSSTPHLDNGIGPEALAVPSYTEEENAKTYDADLKYYTLYSQNVRSTSAGTLPIASGGYSEQLSPVVTKIPQFASISGSGVYEHLVLAEERKVS